MNASNRARLQVLALLFIVPVLFGLLALHFGRDQTFDLLNYHYYNAYAFLNNRLQKDIAPAQLQTFYNPLPDLPFYWMVRHLPSRVVGFLLGAVHGLNAILVFLIYWYAVDLESGLPKYLVGIFIAAISTYAPGFLSEIGTAINDDLISIFILTSLLLLVVASRTPQRTYLIALGGLVIGMGIGLKPNVGMYAIGSGIALPWLLDGFKFRAKALITYAISGVVGLAATAGAWSWRVWTNFGNPLLPYYNNIFRSPYVLPLTYRDVRFLPHDLLEYVFWPLVFSADGARVGEVRFSDVRFAVLYLLLIAAGLILLTKWLRGGRAPLTMDRGLIGVHVGAFLLVFFVSSFVLWMIMFSIYRYAIVLELLVPLCSAALIGWIVPAGRLRLALGALLALVVVVNSSPLSWGRADWSDPYLFVDTSQVARNQRSIVVMLGSSPTAYAVPFMPPGMRFIRPDGVLGLTDQTVFMQEIKAALMDPSRRSFYVLYDQAEGINPSDRLSKLGVEGTIQRCFELRSNVPGTLILCRFLRQ